MIFGGVCLSPEPPYSSVCLVSPEESGLLSCLCWDLREVHVQHTDLLVLL